MNLFEIGHSLARQFGAGALDAVQGASPCCPLLDNHDVTRIATHLTEPKPPAAAVRPAVRYARRALRLLRQRVGRRGRQRGGGDAALRPALEQPEWNGLTDWIARLASGPAGAAGPCATAATATVLLTNRQYHLRAAGARASGCWWR